MSDGKKLVAALLETGSTQAARAAAARFNAKVAA